MLKPRCRLDEIKRRLYQDFASSKALNSFIAHSRKKKSSDGTILDFFMPVKEMTRFYTRELLPTIKEIIDEYVIAQDNSKIVISVVIPPTRTS